MCVCVSMYSDLIMIIFFFSLLFLSIFFFFIFDFDFFFVCGYLSNDCSSRCLFFSISPFFYPLLNVEHQQFVLNLSVCLIISSNLIYSRFYKNKIKLTNKLFEKFYIIFADLFIYIAYVGGNEQFTDVFLYRSFENVLVCCIVNVLL